MILKLPRKRLGGRRQAGLQNDC